MTAPTTRPGPATSWARVLDAVRGRGLRTEYVREREAKVQCPAHEDSAPSLSISYRPEAAKPRTLLRCHAGCDAGDVLAALSLTWSDTYDEAPRRPDRPSSPRPAELAPRPRVAPAPTREAVPACLGTHARHAYAEVTRYPYADDAGTVVGWKVRRQCRREDCGGKTFHWLRELPDGSTRAGAPDPLPLYRQAAAHEAIEQGRPVYVTEGEKDADALADAGAAAVTMGAAAKGDGGAWKAHHTAALAGAHVIVCADRDTAGRRSARIIARKLTGAAASVRVVEAAEGKDPADHLAAGRTLDELRPVELDELDELGEPAGDVEHQGDAAGPTNVVQLPGTWPTGRPAGAVLVPSTRGRVEIHAVTAGEGRGLWIEQVRVAELPHVRARLVERNAAGEVRGWRYLLAPDEQGSAQMVTDGELTSGTYVARLGLDMPADRGIQDAAVTVVRSLARRLPSTELAARWDEGGRLVLPPRETLPAGYLMTAGDEDAARAGWHELAGLACLDGAENLALNLGGAYAAPYVSALSPVRPVSFALVGVGAPRRGKTTNANAAAGWYGSPALVNPVISESGVAIGDTLADMGCLPLFRDEAHGAGWTPKQWHDYWMRSLNGAGRRRAARDGSGVVTATRGWWGVQWWSGNVDPRFGATDGVQARVIVLSDPHLPDRETSQRVTTLLGLHYGWPFRWQLDAMPPPDVFAQLVAAARADLGETPAGSGDTVADSLALTIAGAQLAGELLGQPGLRAAAIRSARRVLGVLVDTIADAPADFGAQLLAAVWADVRRHPALYPPRHEYEQQQRGGTDPHDDEHQGDEGGRRGSTTYGPAFRARDLSGFTWEPHGRPAVSIDPAAFRELTADQDFAPGEALAALADRGLLVRTPGRAGWQQRVKVNGRAGTFYTFHEDAPEGDEGPGSHDDRGNRPPVGTAETASDLHGSHRSHGSHAPSAEGMRVGGKTTCPRCGGESVADLFGGTHPTCLPDDDTAGGDPGEAARPTCPGCGRANYASDAGEAAGWHVGCAERARGAQRPAERPAEVPAGRQSAPAAPAAPRGRQGRARGASVVVVDVDALHTADGRTLPEEVPATLAGAYRLGRRLDVRQVWLTPAAAAALGLPDRIDGRRGAGIEHPWADVAGDGLTTETPGRLTHWLNVWPAAGDRRAEGVAVVLPHLNSDTWADGVPSAEVLAGALDRFARAAGSSWWVSGPVMFRQLLDRANGRRKSGPIEPCRAVLDTEGRLPVMGDYEGRGAGILRGGSRPLTDREDSALFVHRLDRNAAWPSVYESVDLGTGEPRHIAGPVDLRDVRAGYVRVAGPAGADLPGELRPLLRLDDDGAGAVYTVPEARLLAQLGQLPPITEALVWPAAERALRPFGEQLRAAREQLARDDTAAGRAALGMVKATANANGVLADRDATRARGWLWRPDWRDHVIGQASANLLRDVLRAGWDVSQLAPLDELHPGPGAGRWPLGFHVDAAFYASDETTPEAAAPPGFRIARAGGGAWKGEGTVPMPAMREHAGETTWGAAFRRELKGNR